MELNAGPAGGLVHLDFVWQQLAAAVHVGQDLLLQLGHLLPQQAGRGRQVGVLVLQRLHLVLQPGDPLQFAPPTLGGCDPVPEPLPLGFDALLRVHVHGGQRRALPEALHVGDGLRLLLQGLRLRGCAQVGRRRRRERDGVRGVVDRGEQRATAVTVQVRIDRQVRLHRDRSHVRAEVQAGLSRPAQLVLLVQVLQRLHEALRELLLVRHRLRVEELGAGGRRGDHPVGLDDQPLQLRGGQLEQPQIRGVEEALGVAEVRFELGVVRQGQANVLLHHRFHGGLLHAVSERRPAHNLGETACGANNLLIPGPDDDLRLPKPSVGSCEPLQAFTATLRQSTRGGQKLCSD